MSEKLSLASPRPKIQKLWVSLALVIAGILFLAPLLWVFIASFDARAGLAASIPEQFTLDNYRQVLTPEQTFIPLGNSLVLSGFSALITVIVAVLAAYPLSRFRTKFNMGYMYTVLFASGLPITAMMIPVYSLFVQLRMLDNYPAVIMFLATTSLPMAIFMAKNFMDGIPVTLEEAAWVDGASPMRALRSVIIPLMKPGLAALAIFVFVMVWGNFFVPFILLSDPAKMPAAVTIYSFFGQHGAIAYGGLAAYSVIYTIPAVVLYLIITKFFGAFALAGGLKG